MVRAQNRRPRQYRDLGLAIGVLVAVSVVAGGLLATRLGWLTIEVRVALGSPAHAPATVMAARAPTVGTSTSAPLVTPPTRRVSEAPATLTPATSAPALVANTDPVTVAHGIPAAAYPDNTTLTPPAAASTSPAMMETPVPAAKPTDKGRFSRALASPRATHPECAADSGPANVDPSAGDIKGTTGLPDQVMYFKHVTKHDCRSSAGVAAARSK